MEPRSGIGAAGARTPPRLAIVIPCFDEAEVLPVTIGLFSGELDALEASGRIAPGSGILFVDDGSRDATWDVIQGLAAHDPRVRGIRLSRNRGHQNALLAGLMEVRATADVAISIDCDGQDDVRAMERMVDAYRDGCDVVYGVRSSRDTDTFFKRSSAHAFYRLMRAMGVETVFDHADYRLLSRRVLDALVEFEEVNLYLRGMVPLIGFTSTTVAYERAPRRAGESHYPLGRMLALALDGVTSLSVRPIRIITGLGLAVSLVSFLGVVWAVCVSIAGWSVAGWASLICIMCFLGGIQLLSIGIIGEYVGKAYLETKRRPRFIVGERTEDAPSGENAPAR